MHPQKKLFEGLFAHTQLPFVQNKKSDSNYGGKNKKKKGGIKYKTSQEYSIIQRRSDRIKKEYLKICTQIKKNHIFNYSSPSEKTQKLIISESNNGKPQVFGKIPQKKKCETEPMSDNYLDPFYSAIQALKQNRSVQITHSNELPIKNSSAFRYKRKLKPIAGFILKRLESDYLSVQKVRMGLKQIREKQLSSRKYPDFSNNFDFRSESASSNNNKLKIETEIEPPTKTFGINFMSQSLANEQNNKKIDYFQNQNQDTPSIHARHSQFTNNSAKKCVNSQSMSPLKRKNVYKKKFIPPYETYFYRDLLWRVNLANQIIIETPLEYEHRLRVYIGKGNNSGLIRGLIKRRIWFAFTQRIQQANFIWLQLKYIPYFNLQKSWSEQMSSIQNSLVNDEVSGQGLFNKLENQKWLQYFQSYQKIQERQDQKLASRSKYFLHKQNSYMKIQSLQGDIDETEQVQEIRNEQIKTLKIRTILKTVTEIREQKMQNHFKNNYVIGNKKTLFKTMSVYYKNRDQQVFNYLPYTFHVKNGLQNESYFRFLKYYYQRGKEIRSQKNQALNNIWIVKPGEYSNRGYGIKVCRTLEEIKSIIKQKERLSDGSQRTYIVQAYLQKPLLYNKRKFDLRHYMMITSINGILKGYWYQEGYVRTSSVQYSINCQDAKIHLTNDAVQKNMPEYGKHEKGNKISYDELQNYIKRNYGKDFKGQVLPKMKKITTDIIKACSGSIDPNFNGNNFQIFGLDFMIDANFNTWLIQVNTNPCLEISCPLLGSIIPKMIENALELTLDCMYPPPVRYTPKGVHYTKKLLEQNKFDLVYDSRIHGINRESTDVIDENLLQEEDEIYEDDGEEWDQDD